MLDTTVKKIWLDVLPENTDFFAFNFVPAMPLAELGDESDFIGPITTNGDETDAIDFTAEDSTYRLLAPTGKLDSGVGTVKRDVSITLKDISATHFFGINAARGGSISANNVSITAENTQSFCFFGAGRGADSSAGAVASVTVSLKNVNITGAFYASGNVDVSGKTGVEFTNCTMAGFLYGGVCYDGTDSTGGDVELVFNSGAYSAQIYGAGRIFNVTENAGSVSLTGAVKMTLAGGDFTYFIFGGATACSASAAAASYTVTNGVAITVSGANCIGTIYGGGYSCSKNGTGSATSLVENGVVITLKNGTVADLYAGGLNVFDAGLSKVTGGVLVQVTGLGLREGREPLVIGNIYGGGRNISATGTCVVDGGSSIVVGGSFNKITIANIYGGGRGAGSSVNGGSEITFIGRYTGANAANLVITGVVSGNGANGAVVNGERVLGFNNFNGEISARFQDFTVITADGYSTANLSGMNNDFSSVKEIFYNFSHSQPMSEEDSVLKLSSGVSFSEELIITVVSQFRDSTDARYTLLSSELSLEHLIGVDYNLDVPLFGDKFSAAIGDGQVWSYYGYDISLELGVAAGGEWRLELVTTPTGGFIA